MSNPGEIRAVLEEARATYSVLPLPELNAQADELVAVRTELIEAALKVSQLFLRYDQKLDRIAGPYNGTQAATDDSAEKVYAVFANDENLTDGADNIMRTSADLQSDVESANMAVQGMNNEIDGLRAAVGTLATAFGLGAEEGGQDQLSGLLKAAGEENLHRQEDAITALDEYIGNI